MADTEKRVGFSHQAPVDLSLERSTDNMGRREFLQRQRVYLNHNTNLLRIPNVVIILYVQILVKSRINMERLKYTSVGIFLNSA